MKTRQTLIFILALVWGSPAAMAQEDNIFGALTRTAEMHNEAHGENNNDGSSENLTPQQEEWQAEWEAEWEQQLTEEFLNSLDNKYLKCLAMMEMYVYMYLKLVNDHKLGDISLSACDAYGMQTLALASLTTIMYCPEGMRDYELGEDGRIALADEYKKLMDSIENEELPIWKRHIYLIDSWANWMAQNFDNVDNSDTATARNNYIIYLVEFFRPRYIIPRTLQIAQEMEAIGCSKPN